jgi:hypothetical protein
MKHRRRRSTTPYLAALASVGTVAAMVAVPAAATADPCPVGQIVGGNVLCEPIFTPGDGLAAPPPPGLGGPPPRAVPVVPPCQPPKVLSGVLCVEVGPPVAAPPPMVVPPAPVAPPVMAQPVHRAPVRPVPLPRPHPIVRQPVAPPRHAATLPALTPPAPPAPVESAPAAPVAQDCPPQEALVTIRVAWVPLRVGL